jgi:hypothetical protein
MGLRPRSGGKVIVSAELGTRTSVAALLLKGGWVGGGLLTDSWLGPLFLLT